MNYLSGYAKMTRLALASMTLGVLLLETRSVAHNDYYRLKTRLQELLHKTQQELDLARTALHTEVEETLDDVMHGIVTISDGLKEALKDAPEGVDVKKVARAAFEIPHKGLEALKVEEAENIAQIEALFKPLLEQTASLIKRVDAL